MVDEQTSKKSQKELFREFLDRRKSKNMEQIKKALAEEKMYSKPEKKEVQRYFKSYKKESSGRKVLQGLKYRMSRSGRVSSAFQKGLSYIKNPTKETYKRNMNISEQKAFDKKYTQYQKSRLQQMQRARQITAQEQYNKNFYNTTFSNWTDSTGAANEVG